MKFCTWQTLVNLTERGMILPSFLCPAFPRHVPSPASQLILVERTNGLLFWAKSAWTCGERNKPLNYPLYMPLQIFIARLDSQKLESFFQTTHRIMLSEMNAFIKCIEPCTGSVINGVGNRGTEKHSQSWLTDK